MERNYYRKSGFSLKRTVFKKNVFNRNSLNQENRFSKFLRVDTAGFPLEHLLPIVIIAASVHFYFVPVSFFPFDFLSHVTSFFRFRIVLMFNRLLLLLSAPLISFRIQLNVFLSENISN